MHVRMCVLAIAHIILYVPSFLNIIQLYIYCVYMYIYGDVRCCHENRHIIHNIIFIIMNIYIHA